MLKALIKKEGNLRELSLDELYSKACEYGRCRLSQLKDGKFYASIEFVTISNIDLEAKSDFDHRSPKDALIMAIEKAEEIRKEFK